MATLSRKFRFALDYAAEVHASQLRKGTEIPYVSHLLTVTSIVLDNGGSEDEAIAALLHDAVEDGGGQKVYEEIRHCFGENVAEIVAGCTDAWIIPKPPWRQRKEAYVKHIAETSPSVLLVSMADKLANARSMLADYEKCGEKLWTRFNTGKAGQLWYLRALANAFKGTGVKPDIVVELERVVAALETMCRADDNCVKTFIGIDGCRAGWVLVSLDETGEFTAIDIASCFRDAVSKAASAEAVLVDIPIGLREAGPERECDKKGRGLLGPRKSSLFPVPVRTAVHASTYEEACRLNENASGRKISKQTGAICSKIAEVDSIFTTSTALQSKIRETHPELCFTSLNNWTPMNQSKKTKAGMEERLSVIKRYATNADAFFQAVSKSYPSSKVLEDDIIDAMVCAITAREGYRNQFPTIPPEPEVDNVGLKMEMVCAIGKKELR